MYGSLQQPYWSPQLLANSVCDKCLSWPSLKNVIANFYADVDGIKNS